MFLMKKIQMLTAMLFLILLSNQAAAFEPVKLVSDIEGIETPLITEVFVDIGGVSGFLKIKTCETCKPLRFDITKDSEVASDKGPLQSLSELKRWVNQRAEVVSFKKDSNVVRNILVLEKFVDNQ